MTEAYQDSGSGIQEPDPGKQEAGAEKQEPDLRSEDERMRLISQSLKAMAAMTQVGMSFCVVIPGHGVKADCRLTSNYIAPPRDRSESSIVQEICGNISAILEGYMYTMQHNGVTDDAIMGLLDRIFSEAKQRYEEKTAGIGKGAGPQ